MADYRADLIGQLALEEAQFKRDLAKAVLYREVLALEKIKQEMRQSDEYSPARIAAFNQSPAASGTTSGEDTSDPADYSLPPEVFSTELYGYPDKVKQLLWLGHSPETRKVYQAAVESFEDYRRSKPPHSWPDEPASFDELEDWVTQQLFDTSTKPLSRSKVHTALSYLSALRSYYVDQDLDLDAFEDPRLGRAFRGWERLFPHEKALR